MVPVYGQELLVWVISGWLVMLAWASFTHFGLLAQIVMTQKCHMTFQVYLLHNIIAVQIPPPKITLSVTATELIQCLNTFKL